MEFSRFRNFLVASVMLAIFISGFFSVLNSENFYFYQQIASVTNAEAVNLKNQLKASTIATNPLDFPLPEKLANPPEIIRAVYVTGWSAGSKSYLRYLSNIFKTTEINAVVVDIKDYSGLVSYESKASEVEKYGLYNHAISDIDSLVRFFHDKNIYVIGRIAVFEDPSYSKVRPELAIQDKSKIEKSEKPQLWYDNHNLSWLDPASKEVWDYNISIAKDALMHGFDEINFDYIRFPSDGKTKNMFFPVWNQKTGRRTVLKSFFSYLRQELRDSKISADLFGQSTVNSDDLGIGQVIEDSLEYFDYVCPMVYPSHYVSTFMGFINPADHPYEVVAYSMTTAKEKLKIYKNLKSLELKNDMGPLADGAFNEIKLAKLRPWLQDFNMGAVYTTEMVKSEIDASKDSLKDEFCGYMLWSPSNVYKTEAILNTEKIK